MNYYFKNGIWHSVNESSSRYWEIHKGFEGCRKVNITRPNISGFGYDSKKDDHRTMTNAEFVMFLKSKKKEYEYLIRRVKDVIVEVQKDGNK